MRFFNRNKETAPPAPPGHAHKADKIRTSKRSHGREPYSMAKRPSFGQWLKCTWLDIVTMAVMGAIGLGVYMADPAPSRSFAVTFADGEIVYPQFAYPLRDEIIPIWAAALLAALVPIFIFLVMQIRVRSFWDVNNAVIGLLYSLICAAVFQVFIKWLIGGLRPHFLDVCQPDISLADDLGYNEKGFQQIYYTKEICTGDKRQIDDSLESMPSGHTTAAFAGFIFLYLYLNAKLKVFSNYHPAMWKLVAIYAPVLGACLIGGALTIDEFHNWYDVLAGAIIGTIFAFSSYRMVYAAVWDFRFNHIPLNRRAPFMYTVEGAELANAVFTRHAGWGATGLGGGLGHGVGHGHGHAHGHSGTHPDGYNGHNGALIPRRAVGARHEPATMV
ncbi:uncharacterized protein J7T54_001098 [Emericellopsis cladophorae]|uniref:Phosphatidic acid phosphatase type 2/haloperoxidase domain-containing protein n=1 Tax=Emericellopsis cladophorae TaxID=2686198 RepID=A0A9P9XZX5_9HYPO|nr:uncharacterized protein J7T54_001098 [Emericellopsis cladophorae]KAI6780790.1 hypothetical protein J7T54_001098 [Emericellopsis cladophorae]